MDPDSLLPIRLARLRDLGRGSPNLERSFLGAEFDNAFQAFGKTAGALLRDDRLEAAQYLRILAETTLRLRWLAGDNETWTDDTVEFDVDRDVVIGRIARLRKRDLLSMLDALKVAMAPTNAQGWKHLDQLSGMAAEISAKPAPRQIFQLATSPSARAVYGTHRLCSALIHPGAVLGRIDPMTLELLTEQTEGAADICATIGEALIRVTD